MSDQTHEPAPQHPLQRGQDSRQDIAVHPENATAQPLGTQECPNCGAENHISATVCHECGEHLRQRPKSIRCRQCGQRASSNLTLCPSCGRELHAAPSRLWTWIVPGVVGLLLLIFLLSRLDGGPTTWIEVQVDRGMAWVANMSEEMAPEVAPEVALEMTPIVGTAGTSDEIDAQPITDTLEMMGQDGSEENEETEVALQPTGTPLPVPTEEPVEEPTAQPSSTPTDVLTETPTATATEAPTETATPKSTASATATLTPTESEPVKKSANSSPTSTTEVAEVVLVLVPSDTPEPSPTASPRTYDVRAGDTLLSIASRFGVTVEALMAANDIAAGDVYTLRVGQALVLPGNSGLGGPSTQTYTVRAGDTFLNIANRFGLSAETLRTANGLTAEQVRLLRPGQELVIPPDDVPAGQVASATPTSTESAPTATPIPTPTRPALRLDAPMLRSPENNTVVSCQGNQQLAWGGVNFITPTDEYVLHLGFVSGRDDNGDESITWVLRQARPANRTAWDMDNDLCGLAPQQYGRQWRWYVDIVDAEAETVSRPSETWGFSWN